MRKISLLLLSHLAFMAASAGAIQLSLDDDRAQRGSVGYVDMRRLFRESPDAARAKDGFAALVRQAEERLNSKKAELVILRRDLASLETQRSALSTATAQGAAVSVATSPAATPLPGMAAPPPANAGTFPVYYDPSTLGGEPSKLGLRVLKIAYGGISNSTSAWYLDRSSTVALARSLPTDRPVVLDIEAWSSGVEEAKLAENIPRWTQIADWLREGNPGLKLGYFGILPVVNGDLSCHYFNALANHDPKLPVWEKNYQIQMVANSQRLTALSSHVDFIFPVLYTNGIIDGLDCKAHWDEKARDALERAKQYHKPVYAFLWPQLYLGGGPGAETPMSTWPFLAMETWRHELDLVHQYADGAVLWMPEQSVWTSTGTWEAATANFIANLSVKPAAPSIDLEGRIAALGADIKKKESALAREQDEADKGLLDVESRKTDQVLARLYRVISQVAKQEGVSVIVEKNSVIYGHQAMDLTDKVLRRLNFEAAQQQ